jgi:hypothetical protein
MRLLEVIPSITSKKRYTAVFELDNGKKKNVSFGDPNMESYVMHHDKQRREDYRRRHAKDLNTNDPTRAGYLSYYILWGKHRDIDKNIASYKKKFGLGLHGGGTHRQNFLEKNDLEDKGYSIKELAKVTGVSSKILRQVYDRGIGAYKSNPQSVRMKGSFKKGVNAPMSMKLSKEQWAMARVYSFLDNNPKHDNDLRQ